VLKVLLNTNQLTNPRPTSWPGKWAPFNPNCWGVHTYSAQSGHRPRWQCWHNIDQGHGRVGHHCELSGHNQPWLAEWVCYTQSTCHTPQHQYELICWTLSTMMSFG